MPYFRHLSFPAHFFCGPLMRSARALSRILVKQSCERYDEPRRAVLCSPAERSASCNSEQYRSNPTFDHNVDYNGRVALIYCFGQKKKQINIKMSRFLLISYTWHVQTASKVHMHCLGSSATHLPSLKSTQ